MALNFNVNVNVRALRRGLREIREAIMAAKDTLREALDRQTASIDRLAAGGVGTGGLTEEETTAVAGTIDANNARLDAIPVASPAPTPSAVNPLAHK